MSASVRRAFIAFSALSLRVLAASSPAFAQSPNTATISVVAVDQSGAVVNDAKVSVVNNETGALREVATSIDGSATVPALALTGTYKVSVTKPGFTAEDAKDLVLRAGGRERAQRPSVAALGELHRAAERVLHTGRVQEHERDSDDRPDQHHRERVLLG